MPLSTAPYALQDSRWPASGRGILAQFDTASVVVYQAYNPEIGRFAAKNGYFGGSFSLSRMSWIKPNFLWMMSRSGWGTKEGQEIVLAVRILRGAFEEILRQAVPSSWVTSLYPIEQTWKDDVARSFVRLQWDPDHDPMGGKLERRAVQLGLRGPVLERYAREWIVSIEDVSQLVADQRAHARKGEWDQLLVPCEEPYPVTDAALVQRLGLDW
jgi:hypothetical protein